MPQKFQEKSSDLETQLLELVAMALFCQPLKNLFAGLFVYITRGHL
jgi:hypothetical protein